MENKIAPRLDRFAHFVCERTLFIGEVFITCLQEFETTCCRTYNRSMGGWVWVPFNEYPPANQPNQQHVIDTETTFMSCLPPTSGFLFFKHSTQIEDTLTS